MSDPVRENAPKRKRVSACVSCYQAKTKCTGEIPCERCTKLGRKCEPQLRGPGRPSKESRARYERAGVDAFIKFARTDLKHTTTTRSHEPIRSLATCAAFLHQLQSGGDTSSTPTTASGKVATAMSNMLNCTPRALMEEAVQVLWADPSTILEHTDSWMPSIISRLSFSDDPVLTRTYVLGKVRQQTNVAWDSIFFSPVELETLAGGQQSKMLPLLGIVVAEEVPRLMMHLLQSIFQGVAKPDERGRLVQYSEVSYVCPCVDRYQRVFMGLIRIRQCFLSRGAVVAQTVSCTWLPESRFIYDLRSSAPQSSMVWNNQTQHPATVILQASAEEQQGEQQCPTAALAEAAVQQQQAHENQEQPAPAEQAQQQDAEQPAPQVSSQPDQAAPSQPSTESVKPESGEAAANNASDPPIMTTRPQQAQQGPWQQAPGLVEGLEEYRALVESNYEELMEVLL